MHSENEQIYTDMYFDTSWIILYYVSQMFFTCIYLLCALPDARTINHPQLHSAGEAGRILSDGTGFLMTQPSPFHLSLNPSLCTHPPPNLITI